MNERNILGGGVTATFLSGFAEFFGPLKWFFLLGVVLVLADLRFGVEAARVRGEDIRMSRAIRRTLNKVVDYLCWIFLAGALGATFGGAFGTTMLPTLVMLAVYGIEINSCFANYFEAKGKKIKINIFKFFSKRGEILEIEEEEEKENK
ncbi:MAG: phage holin family protein [Bacteroides sp.]|nr:phage holin family protein [Bacteroides sp.]